MSSFPTPVQDSTSAPPPTPQITPRKTNERLSLPFTARAPLAITAAAFAGFSLGITHGGATAGLRFRAENSHRLPTSQVGWYLYHKSKNYHVMLGGIKEGLKMGAKMGFWTGVFFEVEEAVDRLRGAVLKQWVGFRERRREQRGWEIEARDVGLENIRGVWVQRDFLSTVVAAVATAGGFSVWNRFPLATAARTATIGLKAGLVYGLAQDALSLLRGRRLGYVEFVRKMATGRRKDDSALNGIPIT